MKKLKIGVLLLLTLNVAFAQTENLPKQTVEGKAVHVYKIEAGDGWYSIARKFKISYSELKLANKKTEQLKIGEKLFIPSKLKSNDPYFEKNKVDENKLTHNNSGKKITHKVASSETLYAIAKKYNVSVDQIKKTNNLKSSSINKGQVLVISEGNPSKENVIETIHVEETAPLEIVEKPKEPKVESVKEEKPEVDIEKPKSEKETKPVSNADAEDKKVIFANGREEVNESGVASWIEDENSGSNKYYALHRTAPAGTIIKITNRMNSRSIYVKVVGRLPDTGDNEGIIIKVSKSGAEKLGVIDQRFQASLLYGISASK